MLADVKIRRPKDVFDVSDLINMSIKNGKPNIYAPEKLDEKTWYILAFKEEKLIGGIGSILNHYDAEAELDVLTVNEEFRGGGLESALLSGLLRDMERIGINKVRAIPETDEMGLYVENGFHRQPLDRYGMIRHIF